MPFKLILTGATGRIGSAVLQQCLLDTQVTSLVVLTRRPLPDYVQFAKIKILVIPDFSNYTADVVEQLQGADGCIWCMTTTSGDAKLELEYPKVFAEAMSPYIDSGVKLFRYIHLSGALVERNQEKVLWLKGPIRKIKGQAETQMIEWARTQGLQSRWITIVARPGFVVTKQSVFSRLAIAMGGTVGWTIGANDLALALLQAVMIDSEKTELNAVDLHRSSREIARRKEVK